MHRSPQRWIQCLPELLVELPDLLTPASLLPLISCPLSPFPHSPRFDDQCGEFNEAIYRKRFRFLDDYKQSELEDLKKAAKRVKNEDDKQKLQAAMVKYVSADSHCLALLAHANVLCRIERRI